MRLKKGELKAFSELTGLSLTYACDILKRRCRPSPEKARMLERATGISRLAWLYPDEYPNPYIERSTGRGTARGNTKDDAFRPGSGERDLLEEKETV